MSRYEEMVREFNEKADKAVYNEGCKRFEARLADIDRADRDEVAERCAKSAYEDDGYTSEFGRLTVEEMYFLLIEGYDYEVANEYLAEIEYYEVKRVA